MTSSFIKGVMIDMARVTERHSWYRALIPRLADWGYNTLFLHFTDDEGCAMRFRRRPELATPHAFTQAQMRDFVRAAARAGLTVIPEIESFGHTAFIHSRRKYRRLVDTGPGRWFNAINPLRKETRAILADLIAETADVFDAPFIHAGLDEVNFGASPEVRRALKRKPKWQIFADHVNFMHDLVARAGRRMIIWGDHLLHEPQIADAISADIVIADWHYNDSVSADSVRVFTDRGFEVICCPASNRSTDMVMPNALTQINLQRFARIAHANTRPTRRGGKVVGLMNTVWCPQRMLAGIEQFALALGGAWFDNPDADPEAVTAHFLKEQFGLPRVGRLAAGLLTLSAIMPERKILRRLLNSNDRPELPATAVEVRQAGELADQAAALAALFAAAQGKVTRNAPLFAGYVLAADLLTWAARLRTVWPGPLADADRKARHARGRALLKQAVADWNRGRYADDPKRDLNGAPGRWPDALIPNLHLAVARLAAPARGRASR